LHGHGYHRRAWIVAGVPLPELCRSLRSFDDGITMTATEDILFVMPKDREMQFPAMAALQMYVNNYQVKMEANCVTPVMPTYKFRYWAEMADEHWDLFKRIGIELNQDREPIGFPDSVIELTDDKLLSFYNSEKHCSQVCAAIAGVEAPPYPLVRQVKCTCPDQLWVVDDSAFAIVLPDEVAFRWDGFAIGDPRPDGIVLGYQSWQTYAAAAMGLPVVEILEKNRAVNWISKWKNPLYRIVEADRLERLPDALHSIREVLAWLLAKVAAGKAGATGTDRIELSAPIADSTSAIHS
jgi:hypothetical protein